MNTEGVITSGSHEIGYTGGLIHPKEYIGIYYLNYLLGEYNGNMMNQGIDGNQGRSINENQLKKIDRNIDNNNLPSIRLDPQKGTIITPNPNVKTSIK